MAIDRLSPAVTTGVRHIRPPQIAGRKPGGTGFGQTLANLIEDVNEAQLKADAAVRDLAECKTDSLHEVMLAMGKADLSFKFVMQTRNKLVEAYGEIMRMQI